MNLVNKCCPFYLFSYQVSHPILFCDLILSFAIIARPWPKSFAPHATPLKFEILDLMKCIGKDIVHLSRGYLYLRGVWFVTG